MLFGSAILEAAIGLAMIYILISLLSSVINEWASRIAGMRAKVLGEELERLLGPNLGPALNAHPLIQGLFVGGSYPEYIPPSTFALVVMQLGYSYTAGAGGQPGSTAVRPAWTVAADRELLESLRMSATSLSPIQARIEKWFTLSMEQASGRYKRWAQVCVLIVSFVFVAGANIDTIVIAGSLYYGAIKHEPVQFGIGWGSNAFPFGVQAAGIVMKICGIVITWAAGSLGAPFWFDIMNKLVNLRQTGLPPDEDKRARSGLVAQ